MKKSIFCLLTIIVLFIMTSCNEDKKFVEQGKESFKAGNPKEALVYFDKALEANPKNVDAVYNKIAILEKEGYSDDIEKWFKQLSVINLSNLPEDYKKKFLDFLYLYGEMSYGTGNYDQAKTCCDKALEIEPKNETFISSQGWCLYSLGKKDEAIKCFDKILEAKPDENSTLLDKGYILVSQGKLEEGAKCIDQRKNTSEERAFKTFNTNSKTILELIIKGRDSAGNDAKTAETYFSTIIKLDPLFMPAYNDEGVILYILGKYEESVKCFDKVLELNPNDEAAKKGKERSVKALGE